MHPLMLLLILLSAVPDTMAAPVVKELLVDRYGASAAAAQAFNGINLVGALLAVPVLMAMRQTWSARRVLIAASLVDGAILLVMALPLGIAWTLSLRCIEGATDVLVFAALFDLVRRSAPDHLALRLGIASSPLLIGLGIGAVLGGAVVRHASGPAASMTLFGASAALCGLLSVIAWRWHWLEAIPRPVIRAADTHAAEGRADGALPGRFWPPLAMAFADRATGGLLTGMLPVALGQVLGYSPLVRGLLVGLPLLLMALCTFPFGWLADRFGVVRVRIASALAYAGAIALLPAASDSPALLGLAMAVVGVSGSGLFASSVSLAAQAGSAALSLGAFRAAGDAGFLSGTILSVLLLASLGGADPTFADYATVLLVFAGFHLLTTALTALALKVRPAASVRA